LHFAREMLTTATRVFVKCEAPAAGAPVDRVEYLAPTGRLEDHIIYKRIQKSPNVKKFER